MLIALKTLREKGDERRERLGLLWMKTRMPEYKEVDSILEERGNKARKTEREKERESERKKASEEP